MAALITELGGDARVVGEALGLDLAALEPGGRIPFATSLALLDRAAAHTGCAHFGLLLGVRYPVAAHGLVHDLMRVAPTLQRALLDLVTWQLGYSSGGVVYLARHGPDFAFGYGVYGAAATGNRHMYELCAAFGRSVIDLLSDGMVAPQEVQFVHDAPSDLGPYQRILRAPVRFNQPQCCIMLSAADMLRPRTDADAKRHRHIEEAIGAALTLDDPVLKLRHLMRLQLFEDDPSLAGAARVLGLSRRTLRRRLAERSLSYETVRDDVRFTLARELLDMTQQPVGDIATALAFASHSSFDQAFRRWSGTTPSAWRLRPSPT